jgi:phosphate:Na+ symporter
MSASGAMTLSAALPMVLGANIGTTFTPFLAASKAPAEGKRVAFAHAAFKIVGVLVFLPFLDPFAALLQATAGDVSRQIANGHTLFNVVTALAFLPFIGLGATAVRRFYRPSEAQERFGPRYLDPRAIESPALALGSAQREFLRMADIVRDMVKDSIRCFEADGLDLAADIEGRDDKVDILNREIRFYLAKLAQEAITPEQAQRQMDLISLAADLENVGDLVNKNVLAMARKKLAHGLAFSRDGWAEILSFHGMVCENFDLALVAFTTGDEELARKVLRHRVKLVEIETELKEKHIARLSQGLRESLETSSMHLDLLAYYRSINGYVCNLGTTVVSSHEQQEGQRE